MTTQHIPITIDGRTFTRERYRPKTRDAISVLDRATGITTTRTAAEWIALGPGFLCSTEF